MSGQILMKSTGGVDVLEWTEVDRRPLRPNEVRLRQSFAGVNYIDIYYRKGLYPLPSLPATLGVEAVGVIEEVGAEVADWREGDRAAYVSYPIGAYTESRVIEAERLVRPPAKLDDASVATSLLRGATAYMVLEYVAKLQAGQTVLIHSVAGGLGLVLAQWAKRMGAITIGTTSRAKADIASEHGVDHVILYKEESFVERTLQLTNGEGVDLAIDGIGGDVFMQTLDAVKPFGHVSSVGQVAGLPGTLPLTELGPRRSLTLSRPSSVRFLGDIQRIHQSVEAFFLRIEGGLKIAPPRTFPLAEAGVAQNLLESGTVAGAIALEC